MLRLTYPLRPENTSVRRGAFLGSHQSAPPKPSESSLSALPLPPNLVLLRPALSSPQKLNLMILLKEKITWGGEEVPCLTSSYTLHVLLLLPPKLSSSIAQGRRRISCIADIANRRDPSAPTHTPRVPEFTPSSITAIQSLSSPPSFYRSICLRHHENGQDDTFPEPEAFVLISSPSLSTPSRSYSSIRAQRGGEQELFVGMVWLGAMSSRA